MFDKSKKILLESPIDEVIDILEEYGIEFQTVISNIDDENSMDNNMNIDIVSTIILHNPGISSGEVYNMAEHYLCEFMGKEEIRAYINNKMAVYCKKNNVKEGE